MAVKNPECPICGDTFKDGRGLSGHLQFKHGLSGEEHERELEKGMSRGEKRQAPAPSEVGGNAGRSVRDRELELKGMLWEIKEEREQLEEEKPPSFQAYLGGREEINRIEDRLSELEGRESQIREKLQEINTGSSSSTGEDSELAQAIDTEVSDG